jgi:hypothetical protein
LINHEGRFAPDTKITVSTLKVNLGVGVVMVKAR